MPLDCTGVIGPYVGEGQDYGIFFRSSTERRVVSGGKRETVGGDKGRTERRVRDCGTTETRVCMWFWGGAPFRAAAVALIGGRCGVFSGFGQSFCPWISDEFSNALVFAGQAGFAGTRVKSVK